MYSRDDTSVYSESRKGHARSRYGGLIRVFRLRRCSFVCIQKKIPKRTVPLHAPAHTLLQPCPLPVRLMFSGFGKVFATKKEGDGFGWICGDRSRVSHVKPIGSGGFAEVHEVWRTKLLRLG